MNRDKLDRLCEKLGEAQEEYRKRARELVQAAMDARFALVDVCCEVEQELEKAGITVDINPGAFELRFEDPGSLEEHLREWVAEMEQK